MNHRWPTALLIFAIASLAAVMLRGWVTAGTADAGGVGWGQFLLLLVVTPLLMIVSGVAYVIERHARTRQARSGSGSATDGASPRVRRLGFAFMLVLAAAWVQQYLIWRG